MPKIFVVMFFSSLFLFSFDTIQRDGKTYRLVEIPQESTQRVLNSVTSSNGEIGLFGFTIDGFASGHLKGSLELNTTTEYPRYLYIYLQNPLTKEVVSFSADTFSPLDSNKTEFISGYNGSGDHGLENWVSGEWNIDRISISNIIDKITGETWEYTSDFSIYPLDLNDSAIQKSVTINNPYWVEDSVVPALLDVKLATNDWGSYYLDMNISDDKDVVNVTTCSKLLDRDWDSCTNDTYSDSDTMISFSYSYDLRYGEDVNITKIRLSDGQNEIWYDKEYPEGGEINGVLYGAIDEKWELFFESNVTYGSDLEKEVQEAPIGWSLMGSSPAISDMSVFDENNIDFVYIYDEENGVWKIHSGSFEYAITEAGFETFDSIPQYRGFWILKR
jgi:hypothetical protein